MKTLRAWCAVVLFAAAGCSGGGGSSSTVADFCMQYATAMCGISSACGVASTTCVSYQLQQCTAFARTATTDGQRVYTPGNTGDCINKIKAAYNGNIVTPSAQAAIDLACNYVFQGKAAQLKDPCTTQFDCAGATDGSIICDPVAHLCAKKMTVSSGAQCSPVGAVCAQDSYCTPNSANVSLCMPEATMGQACTTVPCDHNTRCVNGLCVALAQSGESCRSSSDCAGGAYCNPYASPPICNPGLGFAVGSPSCACVAQGMECAGLGGTPGSGGVGGGKGGAGGAPSGAAGGPGGAGGQTTGAAGGGQGGAGTAGAGGGPGGAAGGAAGGTAGAAGGAGGAGGALSDGAG